MATPNTTDACFSIGDVSKATGINVVTLRMWENRYGAPFSVKLASGHRRYTSEEISRIRLIKLALKAGHKISKIATLTSDNLEKLLSEKTGKNIDEPQLQTHYLAERMVKDLLDWDDKRLIEAFEQEWEALGPIGFISERVPLFLKRIGDGWQFGEISIAAEHFFSELLQGFLIKKWRPINEQNTGKNILVCSLPDESHSFGLHMTAVVLTTVGFRVVFLGSSTPVEHILTSIRENQCEAVCISISNAYDQKKAIECLNTLSSQSEAIILAGGEGAPENLDGVHSFNSFKNFYEWLRMHKLN